MSITNFKQNNLQSVEKLDVDPGLNDTSRATFNKKEVPSKEEAKEAVRTLLKFIGEDVTREGLLDTPERVIKSYKEIFAGYELSYEDILSKKFYDISSYEEIITLKNIGFRSVCEHHMLSFDGSVDVAYKPSGYVVGISKIARLVDAVSKRLQIQEKMTAQIAEIFMKHIKPLGVAVRVQASHNCMQCRGVMKSAAILETTKYLGSFKDNMQERNEFLSMIKT